MIGHLQVEMSQKLKMSGKTEETEFWEQVKQLLSQAEKVNDGLADMAHSVRLHQGYPRMRDCAETVTSILKETIENLRLFADVFEAHMNFLNCKTVQLGERRPRKDGVQNNPDTAAKHSEKPKRRGESKARPRSRQATSNVAVKSPQILVPEVVNDHFNFQLNLGTAWDTVFNQKVTYTPEVANRLEEATKRMLELAANQGTDSAKLRSYPSSAPAVQKKRDHRSPAVAEQVKKSIEKAEKSQVETSRVEDAQSMSSQDSASVPKKTGIMTAALRQRMVSRKTESEVLAMLNQQRDADYNAGRSTGSGAVDVSASIKSETGSHMSHDGSRKQSSESLADPLVQTRLTQKWQKFRYDEKEQMGEMLRCAVFLRVSGEQQNRLVFIDPWQRDSVSGITKVRQQAEQAGPGTRRVDLTRVASTRQPNITLFYVYTMEVQLMLQTPSGHEFVVVVGFAEKLSKAIMLGADFLQVYDPEIVLNSDDNKGWMELWGERFQAEIIRSGLPRPDSNKKELDQTFVDWRAATKREG